MSGFEHSVPVPRSYKLAAKIAKQVKEEGANLKSLLYEDKNKHFPVQAVHALVVKTLTHENHLSDLLTKTGLLVAEPRFSPWLARVIITELLFGKKTLVSESKPVQTIRQYHEQFLSLLESLDIKVEEVVEKKEHLKPRYIRINTLRLSAADAVRYFQDQGWNLVRCTAGSYDDFLKQVEKLGQYDFMPDYHVKVVFVFAPNTVFYDCELYHNNEIFLQDKATCLAAFLLAPTPGSTVLDMCAAPGMKTTHLAALIRNEGTIYAVEQDKERYGILCDFIEKSGATCVKPLNKDVITVKKDDCPNVDYVLLDPSCSGSGMRRIEGNDASFDLDSGRVQKLATFQAKLLRHALNEYSTAKRVVYSTCSLYSQENEAVIDDVIRNHKGKFRLVSAREKLSKWNNVGDWKHEDIGEKCIYARPESDYTSGFFVAVFERFDDDSMKMENSNDKNYADNPSGDKPRNLSKNNKSKIVELNHLNNGNMYDEQMETFEEELEAQNIFTENVVNNYNGNCNAYNDLENNWNGNNCNNEKHKKKKSITELDSLEETVVESETLPKKDKKSKQKEVLDQIESVKPIDEWVEDSEVVSIKNKRKHKDSVISFGIDLTSEIIASVEEVNTPVKIKKHKKTKESQPLTSVQFVDTAEDISVKLKKPKTSKESNTPLSVQIIDANEDILVKIKKDKITNDSSTLSSVQIVDTTEDISVKNKKVKKTKDSSTFSSVQIVDTTEDISVKNKKDKKTKDSSTLSSVQIVDTTEDIPVKNKKDKIKGSSILSSVQIVDITEDIPVRNKKDKTKDSSILSSVQIVDTTEDIPVKNKKDKIKGSIILSSVQIVDITEDIPVRNKKNKTKDSSTLSSVQIVDTTEDIPVKPKKHKTSKESNTLLSVLIIDANDDIPVKNKKDKVIEKVLETTVIESIDTILVGSGNIPVKSKKHKKKQIDLDSLDVETIEVIEKSAKKDKSPKKAKQLETGESSSVSLVVEETESSKKCRKENKNWSKENVESATDSFNVDSNTIDIVDSPTKKKKRKHLNNEENVETATDSFNVDSNTIDIVESPTKMKKRKHLNNEENVETTTDSFNVDSNTIDIVDSPTKKKKRKHLNNEENVETTTDSFNVDSNTIDIVDSPTKKKKRKHLNNEENVENNLQKRSKSPTGSDCLIISDDAVTPEKNHKKKKNKAFE